MIESYRLNKQGNYFVAEIPSGSNMIFGFKKWTWGEKNALASECSTFNQITGTSIFNLINFNEQMFIRTVFKVDGEKFIPFTIEEVRNMDGQLGERLFQITQQINLVSNVEAQNL